MGLDQTFRDAAVTIMTAFTDSGGIVKTITYTSVGTPTYDSESDQNISTDIDHTTRGVLVKQRDETSDANAPESVSTRVLIAGDEMPVTPKESDYMTIETVRYEITAIRQVPGAALYTFYVRAP